VSYLPREGADVAVEPLSANSLLSQWFWPHYPDDVRRAPFLHRDVDANPGGNPQLAAVLSEAAALFVANAPGLLGEPVTLDDAGVAVLARRLDRALRDRWMAESDPKRPDNLFVQAVVHASAFLGEVLVRQHQGRWELRRPMWESVVYRPAPQGGAISPFHWLLKSLADDAIDDAALAVRWRLHVLQPAANPDTFPVITTAKRLPDLKAPTYDLLVKYLHAHLEGLRDLGEGFPNCPRLHRAGVQRAALHPAARRPRAGPARADARHPRAPGGGGGSLAERGGARSHRHHPERRGGAVLRPRGHRRHAGDYRRLAGQAAHPRPHLSRTPVGRGRLAGDNGECR
jgi:hypothetical protein